MLVYSTVYGKSLEANIFVVSAILVQIMNVLAYGLYKWLDVSTSMKI